MIKEKTITVQVYISDNGKETPVKEMANAHLVNALLKAKHNWCNLDQTYNNQDARKGFENIIKILKHEVLDRMGASEESDEDQG